MKRIFVSMLGLSLLLVSCTAPQPPVTVPPTPGADLFDTPWDDRSIFRAGLVTAAQPALDELDQASIYHLEFRIADDLYHMAGTEEVRYTNAEDVALREVHFRLFPNILGGEMIITNLTADGESIAHRIELLESLMVVPFPQPVEPGQSVILRMDFAVTIPQDNELNYGMLAYFDNVLALAHAYPMIAVYDDEAWNSEVPSQNGDITYADAAFFLVKITAPSDLTLVTSGRKIHRDKAGALQTLSVASGPARDFYLAASPKYEEVARTLGEVTIRSYALDGFERGSQMALDVAERALGTFSARYAPYPYTELDIVSTPTLALGIEYPGMIVITSRIYDLSGTLRGTPARVYMESTVAHEVGHQWFYNLVGDDQLDDPWLDESLTQFVTLQYYADEYGPSGEEGFRNSLEARWDNVDRADIPIGLSVEEYSGPEYGAIVYGRGALFFVELREVMGTEAFDAFIRKYSETLSWEIATPEFLQSLAEEHCTCELDDLFNEWVY